MNILVARQPIFDRSLGVFGYELLHRSESRTHFSQGDGNLASAGVIADGLLSIGIQAMTGGKRAFINFTHDLLLNEAATILPKGMIAVEILEDVAPTLDIIAACKKLKESGYTLVLDDFVLEQKLNPLIELADIIKVDFLQSSDKEKKNCVARLAHRKTRLLAEKVETREVFNQAGAMGYSLFQGYFFGQPEILSGRDIPVYKLSYFRVMQEICQTEINFGEVEKLIKGDVALTYKLLKFINSAYFGLRVHIESIRHALTLLGVEEIKRWLFLIALTLVGKDKPDELMRCSLVRANFCEALCKSLGHANLAQEGFMMGLFSMIDAFFDRSLQDILEDLPLTESVKLSLLLRQGTLGQIYNLAMTYERGDWDGLDQIVAELKIEAQTVTTAWLGAVARSNETFSYIPIAS